MPSLMRLSFALMGLFASPANSLNNKGIGNWLGKPNAQPDWVGRRDDFGSVFNPKVEPIDHPVIAHCRGVTAFSAPHEVENCVAHLRETQSCEDPAFDSLYTFVWMAQGIMFGSSTLYTMVKRDPRYPMDGLLGLIHMDNNSMHYFFNQSSFWLNFYPMLIFAIVGLLFFLLMLINGLWFCGIQKCRVCWAKAMCNCCCNDRKRKQPKQVAKGKLITQCLFNWIYFVLSLVLIIFNGYYSIEFTTPYRMNQSACMIAASNYKLAFGENSLLDVGVRMMSLMVEVGASNHSVMNMTHQDPITNTDGVGHINVQAYDKMCPKGHIAAYPSTFDAASAKTWKDAVGASLYTDTDWEQCPRWTPHWTDVRNSYSKKFSWGRIARDFGRRSYYSMVQTLNGQNMRFLDVDEFKSKQHAYHGYPQTCSAKGECVAIHSASYKTGGTLDLKTTCYSDGTDGSDCDKYRYNTGLIAGSNLMGGFNREINSPHSYYYRLEDRSQSTLLPDEYLGELGSNALANFGLHMNSATHIAQGTLLDSIYTGGYVESPSGITTILANAAGISSEDEEEAATLIGWLRDMCARKGSSAMTLESFCTLTMKSEVKGTGFIASWSSKWCGEILSENDETVSAVSPLASFMDGSPFGRAYNMTVIGSGNSLISDGGDLSNRWDFCDIILARNNASRDDDRFSIDSFVQYFRGAPNSIEDHRTYNVTVAQLGHYPNQGNYGEALAQHSYYRDIFDTENYSGELSDAELKPHPGHIVTPAGGEHPPFLGFSRTSNWLDSAITKATHATTLHITRWPEYFAFLMTIHDAIWVIYDSAMGILPALPVFAALDNGMKTDGTLADGHWINGFQVGLTIAFSVLWVVMVIVWMIAGSRFMTKKKTNKTGCIFRSLCITLTFGQAFFSVCFIVTSLAIPFIGELTLFCNLETMTPLALEGNTLPPLFEDLFGPSNHETQVPGSGVPYTNSLAACLFTGTPFGPGDVLFNFPQEAKDAAGEIETKLPIILKKYEDLGVKIDQAVMEAEFAPLWNNADFFAVDDTSGEWTQRTKLVNLMDIASSLEEDKEKAMTAILNRLDQVVVNSVRGLTKKSDGAVSSFVNTGDSIFDALMSSLVDEELLVTYINETDIDLELDTNAVGVIEAEVQSQAGAVEAAYNKAKSNIWLGRPVADLGQGYKQQGSNVPTNPGKVTRPSDHATNGDFFTSFVPEGDWTADAAELSRTKAAIYSQAFKSSANVPGLVSLENTFKTLAEASIDRYQNYSMAKPRLESWFNGAQAWLDNFFGDTSIPINERAICRAADGSKTTPTQLNMRLQDICVLAMRKPPMATTYRQTHVHSDIMKDDVHWGQDAESLLMPVAGGCVQTFQNLLKTLPAIPVDPPLMKDLDGKVIDPPLVDELKLEALQTLRYWADDHCSSVYDTPMSDAKPFICIRPLRRAAQMNPGIMDAIQPDIIIEAAQDEAQIRSVYSGLLPNHYGLYKGRDARWTNPIYPLFVDSKVDTAPWEYSYAAGNGLGTQNDFGVPTFGAPSGIIFSSSNLPANPFKDMAGFLQYRQCILGPDHVYPISSDRASESTEYLSSLATLQSDIDAKAGAYSELLGFMVNTEMIQRLSTMAYNAKAKGPHSIAELGGVEEYFKIRDLHSLPTPEDITKSNDDIVAAMAEELAFITDADAIVNKTALCEDIQRTSDEAIKGICGGTLGLISALFWLVWFMGLNFMVFYCFGFKQMHYWINLHHMGSGSSSSSSTSMDVKMAQHKEEDSSSTSDEPDGKGDLLNSAFYGKVDDFEEVDGKEVEVLDDQGNTCLHLAAFKGQTETVKKLVELKPNLIDTRNRAFYTPLQIAVYENHLDTVKVLLEAGAKTSSRDEFGDTPLSAAARLGYEEMVDLLLLHGANPLQATRSKTFAEAAARQNGHIAIADKLSDVSPSNAKTTALQYYDDVEYSSYSSYEFEYYYAETHEA